MDKFEAIKQPITKDLEDFRLLFRDSLSHTDGLLNEALMHILNKNGKIMRPVLVMLIARNYGEISDVTLRGAVGLELLHTASLVHDDVVDESLERRGQPSMNAIYNNKVSILVGDYILSVALDVITKSCDNRIMSYLVHLGSTLSRGEIEQLSNISNEEISEEEYFKIIRHKTAALFAACAKVGAVSVNASDADIAEAEKFGELLGIIFQIRDDIFDYYDSSKIGKPTGNDMAERKLTLPVIYALQSTKDSQMAQLAHKVKVGTVSEDEMHILVEFTKNNGGIDYARKKMEELKQQALLYINKCSKEDIRNSLAAYLDYIVQREN